MSFSGAENDQLPFVNDMADTPVFESIMGDKDASWSSNPLVSKDTAYMPDAYGRLRFLGHSSTWSFARQVLNMVYQKAHSSPLPEIFMNIEGDIYGLDQQSYESTGSHLTSGLPALELGLFLLQTVKFHTNCFYHLFDEETLIENVYQFYDNPQEYAMRERIWFSHYLIIMAYGRALISSVQMPVRLPGLDLFSRAIKTLPDITVLCREPIMASEIFCSIALYLQAIDHRTAAHIYVGQAIRMAQSHGLHREVRSTDVGDHHVQRCRRIWWTIYTLDRKFSSLMGNPNDLSDRDITTPLPIFKKSIITTDAFAMHVRICRLLGHVVNTIYGVSHITNKTFVMTTKSVLRSIANLADELSTFSNRCFGDVPKMSADLNLAYHHCVILATRPVVFCLLKIRLERNHSADVFPLPESVKGLIQACVDSANQALSILNDLKRHEMIEIFLPFHLESVFSAALVLHMVEHVHPNFISSKEWKLDVTSILDQMFRKGNLIASLRKAEVEELTTMFQRIKANPGTDNLNADPQVQSQCDMAMDVPSLPSLGPPFFEDEHMDDGLSGAQFLDLANAINEEDLQNIWYHDFDNTT